MESEKYLEGQSMQRPPLFESDGFIYWKNRFETYVKSKDLDLWHVITDGDFPPIQNNPETKKDEVVPFHKQNDDLKKKLAKNNEAKMVIYNALPRKEYERIFMCQTAKEIWDTLLITHQGNNQVKANKIDLLVQQYEQFTIPEEESIDNAFAKFNTIITSLKALDEEDIQYAGSDTRPPMLDRTDFESWQQRIRLYCLGKDNGENIMKSITEGTFSNGYKADIRATNIILQGIPKYIYSLINHYTDAKDIWDNVKMILECSELTKDDRESQLYDEFEHFCQIKEETISIKNYVQRFVKVVDFDQLYAYQLKEHEGRPFQRNNARGNVVAGNAGGQNRDGNVNPADQCDAFDSDVDEGPTTQTMFMAYLTSEEVGASYDSNIPYEVQDSEYDSDCEDK
ncbi:hypothetical protein Tco_1211482 [Tanacetum coccineum]